MAAIINNMCESRVKMRKISKETEGGDDFSDFDDSDVDPDYIPSDLSDSEVC